MSTSSFAAKKLNRSTFLITEDDVYREHPLIYVKIHPKIPVIIIGDTGCDRPSTSRTHAANSYAAAISFLMNATARYTHLRDYLEHCSLPCNNDLPLNPGGERRYLIIISHCHYDHTLGIPQFLHGGQTAILASAAGRDFIESDLAGNGLYRPIGEIAQPWKVTHWAQAFEKLCWPLPSDTKSLSAAPEDLGITIMHTPGHTPDQLAWHDHDEMHLYVGDSFYKRGPEKMDIIWPSQGNLIEWHFSMQKLRCFIRSENARSVAVAEEEEKTDADCWVEVGRRVKVGCGHQTADMDGEDVMDALEKIWWRVLRGQVPVSDTMVILGEIVDRWIEPGRSPQFSFRAPRRLMDDARKFFMGNGLD